MRSVHFFLTSALLIACLSLLNGCSAPQPPVPPAPSPTMGASVSPPPESTLAATTEPTQASTVVATVEPTVVPTTFEASEDFYPADTRLGVPVLDEVIEAMNAGDSERLLGLLHFSETTCSLDSEFAGKPIIGTFPTCRSDEPEHTLVQVLSILGREAGFARPEEASAVLPSGRYALYAAYDVSDRAMGMPGWSAGDYGMIFVQPDNLEGEAVTLLAEEAGIVRLVYSTVPDLLLHQEVGEFLLPPLDPDANGVGSTRITEVPLLVTMPEPYVLRKSGEYHRRGSFISYNFMQPGEASTPYLYEIQFFSEASIRDFNERCIEVCFEGDYPTLESYHGEREAFAAGQDHENATLMTFGGRPYLVSNSRCSGDACVIREYTTFIAGETKVDIWIMMDDASQSTQADELFATLDIQDIDQ